MNGPILVLVAGQDRISTEKTEGLLREAGYQALSAADGAQALQRLREKFCPMVIINGETGEGDGPELCRRIRSERLPGYPYLILIEDFQSNGGTVAALEAGADQVLSQPVERSRLLAALKAGERIMGLESSLKKINEEFKALSTSDSLTGVFNRGYLRQQLPNEIKKFFRYQQPLSLILCDLDGFKTVNDSFGHLAGDFVLRSFAALLQSLIREGIDWVARYGGDEFVIVLPNTKIRGAAEVAARLRRRLAAEIFHFRGRPLRVTASFGVSGIDLDRLDCLINPERLIEEADQNLYRAKRDGKNRVKIPVSRREPLPEARA